LIKGNAAVDILPELWPIALFGAVALAIGVIRYRQTLD
jgi:ABC-2 type transport system permease protein